MVVPEGGEGRVLGTEVVELVLGLLKMPKRREGTITEYCNW